jgi:glycosyltransferase involved in cell wall biosynthesis
MVTSTVIIATLNRPDDLRQTLQGWQEAVMLPHEVRVVDASDGEASRLVCAEAWEPLKVSYMRANERSAALQRNQGAEGCTTDLVVFCDDDVELLPDALHKIVDVFRADTEGCVGGVAGTIVDLHHRTPRRLLRLYYRVQAGYDHRDFGGHFFGPAINLLPTDRDNDPVLFRSQWLNSTLVAYPTELFLQIQFPRFPGYSFQEDVHTSARIAGTRVLYFHRGLRYRHKASAKPYGDAWQSGFTQLVNRWYNATVLLNLHGFERSWKFLLSLVFEAVYLLRTRPPHWERRLYGTWAAWWCLAVLRHDAAALATRETR